MAVLDTIVSSDLSKIRVLPIFRLIKTIGSITEEEMLRTFNCGVGFNLVVSPDKKDDVIRHVQNWYPCYEIGTIEKGDTRTAFRGRISWNRLEQTRRFWRNEFLRVHWETVKRE